LNGGIKLIFIKVAIALIVFGIIYLRRPKQPGAGLRISVKKTKLNKDYTTYMKAEGVTATFFKTHDQIDGFIIIGSNNYSLEGVNIVAAGISSLASNTINSISVLTKAKYDFNRGVDPATYLVLTIDEYANKIEMEKVQVLLQALEIGLRGISSTYGENEILVSTE